jgi:hypothetical protein
MMKKESYGFNTFVGLHVGELQLKTEQSDWLHIPSQENAADVLTRGTTAPHTLGPGSPWQCGPTWLAGPRTTWPVTPTGSEQSDDAEIDKFFHKKSRCQAARIVQSVALPVLGKGYAVQYLGLKSAMNNDHEMDRLILACGDLEKLIRMTARLLRIQRFVRKTQFMAQVGKEHPLTEWITVSADEYKDAFTYLLYWEQSQRLKLENVIKLVLQTITVHLQSFGFSVPLTVLGGCVKNFPIGFPKNEIPIVPFGVLGRLIVLYHHDRHHREVDTIVSMVRHDAWVLKARKLASSIDIRCKICLVKRQLSASQQMGELPASRTTISPAFSHVSMDLFGPLTIRDDCVKRGPRIFKKVYGTVYTCMATRAVYIDVARDYSTESVIHTIRRLMACQESLSLTLHSSWWGM